MDLNTDLDRILTVLLEYSRRIFSREISHSLNNILTPIQIKQQLLTMTVDSSLDTPEIEKIKAIGSSLNALKEFSSSLIRHHREDSTSTLQPLSEIITSTVDNLKALGLADHLIITSDLEDDLMGFNLSRQSIEVLLISFIAHSVKSFGDANITISGHAANDESHFVLTFTCGPDVTQQKNVYPGAIHTICTFLPLPRVLRIVDSEYSSVSVQLQEEPCLKLSLTQL